MPLLPPSLRLVEKKIGRRPTREQDAHLTTFVELGVDGDMANALTDADIVNAFPIQEQTIPLAISGQDIIGQAKTGTGKTLGFGLPILQRLGEAPEPGVQALVVVPTRELANQVFEDIALAAKNRAVQVVPIYGGKAYEGQIEQLKQGAQIVVGTPGRLLDLANQRLLDLGKVREMVLDEADKMLDLGFLADIEKLFSLTPVKRHTMLFSATMPGTIVTLARRFMSKPIHIRATDPDEGIAQANIRHLVYRVHSLDKDEMIGRILQAEGRGKTVIFTRTKRQAAKLQEELTDRGFLAAAVHGDLGQEQRERHMASFRAGKKDVLIATDVAARGIDVNDVTHVINHTVPDDEKTYLHRVGRTGRAGQTGIAVTFIDWEDLHKWTLIDRALGLTGEEPQETYSSSPHLREELNIPEGVKGRIVASSRAASAGARKHEQKPTSSSRSRNRRRSPARRGTQEQSSQNHEQNLSSADGSGNTESPRKPRRRRRRRSNNAGAQSSSQKTNPEHNTSDS